MGDWLGAGSWHEGGLGLLGCVRPHQRLAGNIREPQKKFFFTVDSPLRFNELLLAGRRSNSSYPTSFGLPFLICFFISIPSSQSNSFFVSWQAGVWSWVVGSIGSFRGWAAPPPPQFFFALAVAHLFFFQNTKNISGIINLSDPSHELFPLNNHFSHVFYKGRFFSQIQPGWMFSSWFSDF